VGEHPSGIHPGPRRLPGPRPQHSHRRPGAGDHDRADHHRHHPRGVPADAEAARRGIPGPGGHPLGDDPTGRAAVRPLRGELGRDARPRSRAGGDHGGADGPLAGVRDQLLSAQTRPAPVDRRQYRQPLPRGGVHGRERADRFGADPVRADLRGEPPRPVDHQPPRRILWSQLMNTIAPPLPVRRHRKLQRWVPYAILAASAVGSAGILALLTGDLPVPGLLGMTAVLYTVSVTVTSHVVEGPRWAKDRLATALVTGAFLVALIPLVSLLGLVVVKGALRFGWDFLSTDMVGVFGSMTSGGIFHAIIGTLYVTGIAAIIAVPLGIMTAIYLAEYGQGKLKRAITVLGDVMTGSPSIVAGLRALTVFLVIFGPGYFSAVVGGVGLALLMTPLVIRNTEEMLRLVPNELREASYALGVPKWLTIVKIVLRTSIGGITTGVVIALARIIGETAPLLVTVGITTTTNWDAFNGRIATLPVYVYQQYSQGGAAADRAWAGALALIVIVMLLNLTARLVSRYFSPKGIR